MVVNLTSGQVSAWRMKKQHLARRKKKGELARVVSDVCGVQAQVLSAAELGLRARVEGLHQEDVRRALWADHTLVKIWSMRGTLHLLAVADLPLYLAGLRTRLLESKLWLGDNLGVSAREVDLITEEIGRILSKSQLTREELALEVEKRLSLRPEVTKHLRSGWGVLLKPAAYQGNLVFGENIGPKATFFNPKKWKRGGAQNADKALEELFYRFLRSYGPATTRDFGHWWGGLRESDRALLESSTSALEEVFYSDHKQKGYMVREDAMEASRMEPPKGVRLLPSFDCYAMFYHPRDIFVSRQHRERVFRQSAGWNYPAILVDGAAAGIWSLKRGSRKLAIDLEQFRPFNRRERSEVREEAADIGRFLGAPIEVRPTTR